MQNDVLLDIEKVRQELSRRDLLEFTEYTLPIFDAGWFHEKYYQILTLFAKGIIKRLIVTCPPQHGKSEGSTRRLPAFMLGNNPELKIVVGSYSSTQAKKFGRDIKRIMLSDEYAKIFNTKILKAGDGETISNADEFEVVGSAGSIKLVGRKGAITGNPVDIGILDDLYKDSIEGNSPVTREAVWDFFINVFKSRLHNNSQELIVFTRWHEDDLIGRLEKQGKVIVYDDDVDLYNIPNNKYLKINFEAIKTGDATNVDPRQKNEPLWSNRHNLESLIEKRSLDADKFNCLYQGNPMSASGLLYSQGFKTYDELPANAHGAYAKVDTADSGTDYLCSIAYMQKGDYYYITDVVYSQAGVEVTEGLVSDQFKTYNVKRAEIESNAGGKAFSRNIRNLVRGASITPVHQSANKESRIITNAALVMDRVIMPDDWHIRWPEFYDHLSRFKKLFKANAHDDAADTLTMIVEKQKGGGVMLHGKAHKRSFYD